MVAIHVFAIDWVPSKDDIASGGGLRSLQIIEALRDAGHQVTFSVPANCRHIRGLGRASQRLRDVIIHDQGNQIDILRDARPEVVFWLPTLIRNTPFTGLGDLVHVCDLIGLPHIEAAMGAAGRAGPIRERIVELCTGADLLLTGSEEQHGYWLAELTRQGGDAPTTVVPFALPAAMHGEGAHGAARLTRLHVTGMVYAWSTSVERLRRAAAWVAQRDGIALSVIVGTDPGGATDRSALQALNAIAAMPHVEMPGEVSFGRAMADYGAGSVALDLYEPGLERRLAVPVRSVIALAHGVPSLTTIDSTLTRRLHAAGAAVIAPDTEGNTLEKALDSLATLSARQLSRMAVAARDFATREYNPVTAANTLNTALDQALRQRAERRRRWHGVTPEPDRIGHVLIISDVAANLRELRIDIPFGAMQGRGLIAGYSVWSDDEFAFSTSANPARQDFDAIWVQREIRPHAAVALTTLARPFVYDLDDDLLASPAYRQPFTIEVQQTVRNMIWSCRALSCSTARLAQNLQVPALEHLVGKVVVTPNLLREPPGPRIAGAPRLLVWASSDVPALTRSYQEVCRAIRDFCLTNQLTLACIGVAPPDILTESEVVIQHIGHVPYGSYLSLLRSFAPAIMVCPLETNADFATRDFVDSKSDIKMLEALASGLVGVGSRAPAYLDSDLPGLLLCENTYPGWMQCLREAMDQCTLSPAPRRIPPERCAGTLGTRPWFDALSRVRLTEPLPAAAFIDALRMLRGRYGRRQLSELEFDETFYLNMYPDVRAATDLGALPSAFVHYAKDGFQEGRLGRRGDVVEPHDGQVWANLLNTLGDLRQGVELQAQEIETLKARRATRLRLRRAGR